VRAGSSSVHVALRPQMAGFHAAWDLCMSLVMETRRTLGGCI
jgi:hypothetical protein